MESKVDQFKAIMGSYPTGVTIVTTMDQNQKPVGMTVNSFASVSLDPLMVLWCIDHRASNYGAFKHSDSFAVHVLAAEQKELCMNFSKKGIDRFSMVEWTTSVHGLPILPDVLGVFECKKIQEVEAGDHTILIGEVISLHSSDKDPLFYFRRNVGSLQELAKACITR